MKTNRVFKTCYFLTENMKLFIVVDEKELFEIRICLIG